MMKRILISLLVLLVTSSFNTAAYGLEFDPISETDVNNRVLFTGQGYFKLEDIPREKGAPYTYASYSKDGVYWTGIGDSDSHSSLFAQFLNYDNTYNGKVMEEDDRFIFLRTTKAEHGLNNLQQKGKIIITDKSFHVLKTLDSDYFVSDLSCIDGVYYANRYTEYNDTNIYYGDYMTKQESYRSTDLENWTLYRADGGIPFVSAAGKTVLVQHGKILRANYTRQAGTTWLIQNGNPVQKIAEEPMTIFDAIPVRGYLIGNPTQESQLGKIGISKDGVYYKMLDLPLENEIMTKVHELTGKRVDIETRVYDLKGGAVQVNHYVCAMEDLFAEAPEGGIYVQVNDEVLGFSTPPVTENDRTLVPMRFLFEKLGAEVNWDETTNTAIATMPADVTEQIQTFGMAKGKSVSFSIDNITATVNGETAAMDVPARLVNDKTLVPLRFLSENLGYTVTWDEANNTAIITK